MWPEDPTPVPPPPTGSDSDTPEVVSGDNLSLEQILELVASGIHVVIQGIGTIVGLGNQPNTVVTSNDNVYELSEEDLDGGSESDSGDKPVLFGLSAKELAVAGIAVALLR